MAILRIIKKEGSNSFNEKTEQHHGSIFIDFDSKKVGITEYTDICAGASSHKEKRHYIDFKDLIRIEVEC